MWHIHPYTLVHDKSARNGSVERVEVLFCCCCCCCWVSHPPTIGGGGALTFVGQPRITKAIYSWPTMIVIITRVCTRFRTDGQVYDAILVLMSLVRNSLAILGPFGPFELKKYVKIFHWNFTLMIITFFAIRECPRQADIFFTFCFSY